MCGRFTLIHWEDLVERFGVGAEGCKPRYNIAPTQNVSVIVQEDQREIHSFRWGFVPSWSKKGDTGSPLINARAETVREKYSFRHSFREKRCLVPADGFYEWAKNGAIKMPYHFTLKDEKLFAFAGLWDVWQTPAGTSLHTVTIITTAANSAVLPYHHRMPVILSQEVEDAWLDLRWTNFPALEKLLVPCPAERMKVQKASPLVNNVKNDSSAVLG